MFRKPFKVKSNNQLKGSERRHMREQFLKGFPSLSEADVDQILSKKETVNVIKIVTSGNETVQVFAIQKCPLVFEVNGVYFPTVYLLWKCPGMIPVFITHCQVVSYINSGADLMLPGVVTPPPQSGLPKYGNVQANEVAYVGLSDNKAAIAVGVAAQCSADMLSSGGRGKCIAIYHHLGDKLCTLEGPCLPLEKLGPPEWLVTKSYDEDFPELGVGPCHAQDDSQKSPLEDDIDNKETEQENDENSDPSMTVITPEEMDKLLSYCFLTAVKYSKSLTLPILTSNFFKLQMIPAVPEGKTLDLKKSSFKKLKPFLDSMCKSGFITVSEVKKGVESITSINKDHPGFSEFYVPPSSRPGQNTEEAGAAATSVQESYIITPNVMPIFSGTTLKKGDIIHRKDIRKYVTEFVKNGGCQDEADKRFVKPKGDLVKICKTENNITWEELVEKVCESMKSCYKVSTATEEIINKGKVSPIIMTISKRSGNKKVTLVDNLELFGIRIPEFAKECQHGVAASTSISKPPGSKSDQLLVQGNQINFVHALLTEKYKVPAKYIRGLELAPKKRKH